MASLMSAEGSGSPLGRFLCWFAETGWIWASLPTRVGVGLQVQSHRVTHVLSTQRTTAETAAFYPITFSLFLLLK